MKFLLRKISETKTGSDGFGVHISTNASCFTYSLYVENCI